QRLDLSSPEQEKKLIAEFEQSVEELYAGIAAEEISSNWAGTVEVGFMGGSPDLLMERIFQTESPAFHSRELFAWLCRDILPSSVLLPARVKSGNLSRQLNALVTQTLLPRKLQNSISHDDWTARWRPLAFFEVYKENEDDVLWERLGLWRALDAQLRWCY